MSSDAPSWFSSSTLLVASLAALIGGGFVYFLRSTDPTPSVDKGADLNALYSKLGAFAQVARECYKTGMEHIEVELGHWRFDRLQRLSEGFISIWRVSGQPKNSDIFPLEPNCQTYVVAVRGSHLFLDWTQLDFYLAFLPARFLEIGKKKFQVLTRELEEILPSTSDVRVVFCGHSVGSSVAEMFCHLSRLPDRPVFWQRVRCVGAITFDSPGLDPGLYSELQMDDPQASRIVIVNSALNIVNMLFKPYCQLLFACGLGSQITLFHVCDLVLKLLVAAPWEILMFRLKQNAEEHPMTKIIAYISDRQVNTATPDDWWNLSGWMVRLTKTCVRCAFSVTAPPSPPDSHENLPVVPAVFPHYEVADDQRRDQDLKRVPSDINLLQNKVPYYVGVNTDTNLSDLHDFLPQRNTSDFFIPVIGMSDVGKSSFIKAVLGLSKTDRRIPVGSGGNVSQEILIAAYQGGADTAPVPRTDVPVQTLINTSYLTDLASKYEMISGCAVWVVDTNIPYNTVIDDVKKFIAATNFRLLVVVNDKRKFESQAKDQLATIRKQLLLRGVIDNENDVVMVSANVEMDDVKNIKEFHDTLMNLIERHGNEINARNNPDEFIASEAGRRAVEAEKGKMRTWGRFFADAGYGTGAAVTGGLIAAAVFAIPAACIGAVWVSTTAAAATYIATTTTVSVAGFAAGGAACGGVTGAALGVNQSVNSSDERRTAEAIEEVRKQYIRDRPSPNAATAANRTRVFLLDIPGHGVTI
jgi:GTP-binding protein EngB required for normal cell division